jgi:ABC-type antimicrobial peptide transport system permease subunit
MDKFTTAEILIALFVIGFIIAGIFFLITQQNILKAIQPENRMMSPGDVWLQLIPIFNIAWQFVVVSRIAQSIEKEMLAGNRFSFEEDRPAYYQYQKNEKPTYTIGMAACVLRLLSWIPFFGVLTSLGCFLCWMVYWNALSNYKRKIEAKNYLVSPPSIP